MKPLDNADPSGDNQCPIENTFDTFFNQLKQARFNNGTNTAKQFSEKSRLRLNPGKSIPQTYQRHKENMKTLIAAIILLMSVTQARASMDCSQNKNALTLEKLTLVFSRYDSAYSPITGNANGAQSTFNLLVDPSCAKVQVFQDGRVFCTDTMGNSALVGYRANRNRLVGQTLTHDFELVRWRSNLVLKSQYNDTYGCIYGIAVSK